MKEEFPYSTCSMCRTLDDCPYKIKTDNELSSYLPPDDCPHPLNVLRRTMRKRKKEKVARN
jgi:hypothetical protein